MLESPHGPLAQLVERVIRIDEASGSNPLGSTVHRAYGVVVTRDYGIVESRVRFPIGPQNFCRNAAVPQIKIRRKADFD